MYAIFRGLRTTSRIDKLSRINLVTGRNNAGKTTLIEAILLLGRSGQTRAWLSIPNVIRGFDTDNEVSRRAGSADTYWKPLFSRIGHEQGSSKISGFHTAVGCI